MLKELPSTFWSLSGLQMLTIQNCPSFKELPPSVGQLTSLLALELDQLNSLPFTIGCLTGLQQLIIRECSFKDMPRFIEPLTALQYLSVSSSDFNYQHSRVIRDMHWVMYCQNRTVIKALLCALPSLQLLHLYPTTKEEEVNRMMFSMLAICATRTWWSSGCLSRHERLHSCLTTRERYHYTRAGASWVASRGSMVGKCKNA